MANVGILETVQNDQSTSRTDRQALLVMNSTVHSEFTRDTHRFYPSDRDHSFRYDTQGNKVFHFENARTMKKMIGHEFEKEVKALTATDSPRKNVGKYAWDARKESQDSYDNGINLSPEETPSKNRYTPISKAAQQPAVPSTRKKMFPQQDVYLHDSISFEEGCMVSVEGKRAGFDATEKKLLSAHVEGEILSRRRVEEEKLDRKLAFLAAQKVARDPPKNTGILPVDINDPGPDPRSKRAFYQETEQQLAQEAVKVAACAQLNPHGYVAREGVAPSFRQSNPNAQTPSHVPPSAKPMAKRQHDWSEEGRRKFAEEARAYNSQQAFSGWAPPQKQYTLEPGKKVW